MKIRSIGMQTDAMFAAFDGEIIDRGDYVVVRTPTNPTFFWGNHIAFPEPPRIEDIEPWSAIFERELPMCHHRAFFCDRPDQSDFDAEPFRALGFTPDPTCVMRLDGEPHGETTSLREITHREDWERIFTLLDRCFTPSGNERYRRFLRIQVDRYARMIASGFGHWFAIDDIATCGIFPHAHPYWRFQLVAVHPDHRGQGHASRLVASVTRAALARRAAPVIIGCVPGSQPERIYRRLGFREIERTIALVRPAP